MMEKTLTGGLTQCKKREKAKSNRDSKTGPLPITNEEVEMTRNTTANPTMNSKPVSPLTESTGFFAQSRRGSSRPITWLQSKGTIPLERLKEALLQLQRGVMGLMEQGARQSERLKQAVGMQWQGLKEAARKRGNDMIGPLEKGIQAAQVSRPISGAYEGLDLRVLPKYICFRAALLQNKLTLQYVVLILSAILLVHFASSRYEVHQLYAKLREKEYILAPGVQDFTPAHPHTVPDSYVANAVTDFLGQLGNVTASTIDEQYALLADSMSPQLKIRFLEESAEYKSRVKSEGISELLSLTDKEIRSTGNGHFLITALGRRDTYINHEYVGNTDEVIEMTLELVAPKSGKRWYLQINTLTRQSANTFRAKKKF